MTGMNRLSPWIVRRLGEDRLSLRRRGAAVAAALPAGAFADPGTQARLDDLRLFFTGWAGGLVFFFTLLG